MARPTTDLSDHQLREGINNGAYEGWDAALIAEILKDGISKMT